ncbi:hypothetical protein MLD38_028156 [Melastoma candidum]|uniref:Uncharacterized protein n=1 Tax=Melastoma candidum TaxID=119954 RepID=A0ACB9N0R0_9MYRT|nr:hypothetical protein MLD38_028156 [Melastoma candidum]
MDCGRSASTISAFPSRMGPSFDSNKGNGMAKAECPERAFSRVLDSEPEVDIDLRELYFLIMHFLSSGPCEKTFRQLSDELLEHQLLPRRYHAWFSRSGMQTGSVDDDGISFPLNYFNLVDRYPHIQRNHLLQLLKQLVLRMSRPVPGKVGGRAAHVPTLLGFGSFSLLDGEQKNSSIGAKSLPTFMRWPHLQSNQIHGLSLRELGGGFTKHQRSPSVHSACHAVAKPFMLIQRMQNIKKLRGHRVAVYCAIFDRSGRYVITGSDDRLVKVWSMETAFCLASCRGHEGDITDLAVSANNILVASASNDFVIRVWRLPDGLPTSVLRGHTGAVTAIAFSPRASSVYQLLSSSDDGTCRVWDARYSQCAPRIYLPKPLDNASGRIISTLNGEHNSNVGPQSHQILCCAYNANGTVFVTGSSDTFARVWSASKSSSDDPQQPVHELDLLAGHENDVNYVQFSGCSVAPRSSVSDAMKEENIPKFRNSWFCHDNIVTCSRDGSAIIWGPKSRKSNGKGGRWTKAYHLKVPPPPFPPQPPRGGPRQRFLPTPRGVNMIVWSLDNRFVLAAIMDCRICVWNASDGSLVHSLTGHSESSYVLDVHPSNARIAMSAGYDGKAIVWDIWEGSPIQVYEIGRVKLIDGKFSPDGTSIVLSDDFGQIHLVNTGQGESQKDAKYDQFFLGDYRPLIRDSLGNVLDQESQLPPHRRNLEDPLCDSSLVPYPEPYQSMFQKRRLGALGVEWRPPSTKFLIGPDFSLGHDYPMIPLADINRTMEPMPDFADAVYWEPDIEIRSDDSDSEYNIADDSSSAGEKGSLSMGLSSDPECSEGESDLEHDHEDGPRRSGRKKLVSEVDGVISGRHATKRSMEECESSAARKNHSKRLKGRRKSSTKSSGASHLRPKRLAARNAISMFSQISGSSSEDSGGLIDLSSGSESPTGNRNTEILKIPSCSGPVQQDSKEESEQAVKDGEQPACHNDKIKKKLVLKFSLRDTKKTISSDSVGTASVVGVDGEHNRESIEKLALLSSKDQGSSLFHSSIAEGRDVDSPRSASYCLEVPASDHEHGIKWGEVKIRSSIRQRPDNMMGGESPDIDLSIDADEDIRGETNRDKECSDGNLQRDGEVEMKLVGPLQSGEHIQDPDSRPTVKEEAPQKATILRIKTKGPSKLNLMGGVRSSSYSADVSNLVEPSLSERGLSSEVPRQSEAYECSSSQGGDVLPVEVSRKHLSLRFHRSPNDVNSEEAITSNNHQRSRTNNLETASSTTRRARSLKINNRSNRPETSTWNFRRDLNIPETTECPETSSRRDHEEPFEEEWTSSSRMVRSRTTRNKGPYHEEGLKRDVKVRTGRRKQSWLTLSEHEEGYRYIPQLGDEVVYLRQGHEEFINKSGLREVGPWNWRLPNGGVAAAEICKVEALEYGNSPGSGDSCCKMILKFVDPGSAAFSRKFKLTLPELLNFPDFIVEKTLYDHSLNRWTLRNKCSVWWRNEDGVGGCWWVGKIVSSQPKSLEFPDSPWERYTVRYSPDPQEIHCHSPWELHDIEAPWNHPHIDHDIRNKLLSIFVRLELSINENQDYYGYGQLNEAAQKSDFSNRFPVDLDPELIQLRLENNYYRTIDAVKHDIKIMLQNAETYFQRSRTSSTKMKRLSEWLEKALSKLNLLKELQIGLEVEAASL